jgi:excisionase family DNA binding protein
MLTVSEAAYKLGVTPGRVRNMIHDGILPAQKLGRNWILAEGDIDKRRASQPHAGRPSAADYPDTWLEQPAINERDAHKLYEQCKQKLSGCYDAPFLTQAKSREEQRFYLVVADFFLQQKQRELVADGVF